MRVAVGRAFSGCSGSKTLASWLGLQSQVPPVRTERSEEAFTCLDMELRRLALHRLLVSSYLTTSVLAGSSYDML